MTQTRSSPEKPGRFTQISAQKSIRDPNSIPVAGLNRQDLRFARLAAKDVAAGNPEMVLRLGITREQIEFLGSMTNDVLNRLAFGWDGPIIRLARLAFDRGMNLHIYGAQHHATALVASQFLPYARQRLPVRGSQQSHLTGVDHPMRNCYGLLRAHRKIHGRAPAPGMAALDRI